MSKQCINEEHLGAGTSGFVDRFGDSNVVQKTFYDWDGAKEIVLHRFIQDCVQLSQRKAPNILPLLRSGFSKVNAESFYRRLTQIKNIDVQKDVSHYPAAIYPYSPMSWSDSIKRPEGWQAEDHKFVLYQVIKACFLLEQVGIYHLDIKPDNVLVHRSKKEGPWMAQLADFGLLGFNHEFFAFARYDTQREVVTPTYKAPEQWFYASKEINHPYYSESVLYNAVMSYLHMLHPKYVRINLLNAYHENNLDSMYAELFAADTKELHDYRKLESENDRRRWWARVVKNEIPLEVQLYSKIQISDPVELDFIKHSLAWSVKNRMSLIRALQHDWFKTYVANDPDFINVKRPLEENWFACPVFTLRPFSSYTSEQQLEWTQFVVRLYLIPKLTPQACMLKTILFTHAMSIFQPKGYDEWQTIYRWVYFMYGILRPRDEMIHDLWRVYSYSNNIYKTFQSNPKWLNYTSLVLHSQFRTRFEDWYPKRTPPFHPLEHIRLMYGVAFKEQDTSKQLLDRALPQLLWLNMYNPLAPLVKSKGMIGIRDVVLDLLNRDPIRHKEEIHMKWNKDTHIAGHWKHIPHYRIVQGVSFWMLFQKDMTFQLSRLEYICWITYLFNTYEPLPQSMTASSPSVKLLTHLQCYRSVCSPSEQAPDQTFVDEEQKDPYVQAYLKSFQSTTLKT